MTETILLDTDGAGTTTVTLNRPQTGNAFDDHLIAALTGTFERVGRDARTRTVILTGAGKHFCAGADIEWMRRSADYDETDNRRDAAALAEMLHVLNTLDRPVVARVQGAAFGGGVGLIACCDIVVASDKAIFALSEVRLGLIPAVISPYVVGTIGQRTARRYFLTGERFDADEARRIGLVHDVVPESALDERIRRVVDSLSQGGPDAQRAAKRLIADVGARPVDAGLRAFTADRIAAVRATSEAREGLGAFIDRREPQWRRKPS